MTANNDDFKENLWRAVDRLRTSTSTRISDFLMPLLGIIFLKFADQKFNTITETLRAEKSSDSSQMFTPANYKAEGVIYLDERTRFSHLRMIDRSLGEALTQAMERVERDNPDILANALSINYTTFDDDILHELLRIIDHIPQGAESEAFEYFLTKFALTEGYSGNEFFTPTSIIKLIVEIAEPFHGHIFDPACGSGGMLVQSARFAENHERNSGTEISIYGQDKVYEAVRLSKMNLAIHELSGDIRVGNTYYQNMHEIPNRFDFVISVPPLNVDGVDKSRLNLELFPFGLPRTNNANYLWVQLFYSALNKIGRAGFAMPNSAGDARWTEQEIRHRLIQDQVVDVVIAVGSNFLYNTSLPCTLWFLDKGKRHGKRGDKVLFVDARQFLQQIDRTHREFSPAQIEFLANIVRLYRGELVETKQGSGSWLLETFPNRIYRDVSGLCKLATLAEIEAQRWSLNPLRYVEAKENVGSLIERNSVFISYSHNDKKYLDRLHVHLNFLKRTTKICIWDDTMITPGDRWREEIKKAISSAKVAIVLVSADFLASKFIVEDELPPLLKAAKEENAIILPVIVSPCRFEDSQLAAFQAVNDPSKPLIRVNQYNKELTWDKVVQSVKKELVDKK